MYYPTLFAIAYTHLSAADIWKPLAMFPSMDLAVSYARNYAERYRGIDKVIIFSTEFTLYSVIDRS